MVKCRDCINHYIEYEEHKVRKENIELIEHIKCKNNELMAIGGEPRDPRCFVPIE